MFTFLGQSWPPNETWGFYFQPVVLEVESELVQHRCLQLEAVADFARATVVAELQLLEQHYDDVVLSCLVLSFVPGEAQSSSILVAEDDHHWDLDPREVIILCPVHSE
jgi:hypothetical protein